MRHTSFLILILTSSLALFGAGCFKQKEKKPPRQPITAPKQIPSTNPPVVSFPSSELGDASINAELDRILKNFRSVKSFRMKLSSSTPQGELKSVLEYLRPDRFRGALQIANQPSTEVIVVDRSLYMRPTNGKWVDLSGTEAAKAVGASLRNALSGDASLEKIGVSPDSVVKKTRDEARQCDLYTAVVRSRDGSPGAIEICAVNQLPKFVTLTTSQGPFTFEYYDYNQLFLIERPM